jgi:M6 family metalloprotease-like protein
MLLGVGLLAGCASSRSPEQVAVLGADVADLRERMNELQGQVAELTAYREVAACRLPNQVGADHHSVGFPISPERIPASGNVNVAVLFVDFPDAPALEGTTAWGWVVSTHDLFGRIVSDAERYLEAISYGTFDVTFRPLYRWLRMPHGLWYYGDPERRQSIGTRRFRLIGDAIGLADPDFNFEGIDSVVVIAAPEADSISRVIALQELFYVDGQTIGNSISLGSRDGQGPDGLTIPHELGHNLGLPDLYDTSVRKDSEGNLPDEVDRFVGEFGLMGVGQWSAPAEMFAWSRWQLGWLRDTQVACITSFPTSVQLTPLPTPGGIKAVVVPLTETTALVVESRRALGYDFGLRKEGALVYKIDTSVPGGEGPIVVGSTSKPPDHLALLGPGEVWNSDGYSVTVKEVTPEGDLVEITAP